MRIRLLVLDCYQPITSWRHSNSQSNNNNSQSQLWISHVAIQFLLSGHHPARIYILRLIGCFNFLCFSEFFSKKYEVMYEIM